MSTLGRLHVDVAVWETVIHTQRRSSFKIGQFYDLILIKIELFQKNAFKKIFPQIFFFILQKYILPIPIIISSKGIPATFFEGKNWFKRTVPIKQSPMRSEAQIHARSLLQARCGVSLIAWIRPSVLYGRIGFSGACVMEW